MKDPNTKPQGLSRIDRMKMLQEESAEQRKVDAIRRKAEVGRINTTDVSVSPWYQMDSLDRIFHEDKLFINESKHMLNVNVMTLKARRENQPGDATVVFTVEQRSADGKAQTCVVIRDK